MNPAQDLQNSLERYQSLIDNLSIGIYRNTSGPQGRFLEVNPAIVAMFEADTKEELMNHAVSDLYQDPAQRSAFVAKITSQGFVKNEELELVTLKGRKLTCSVSAVMKKDKDGNVFFDGTIEDITPRKWAEAELEHAHAQLEERVQARTRQLQITIDKLDMEIKQRKQTEEKLKQTNAKLEDSQRAIVNVLEDLGFEKENMRKERAKDEAILASIGDAVVFSDKNGLIVLFNVVAEALTGFTASEVIGRHYSEILKFVKESNGEPCPDFIAEALSTGRKINMKNHNLLIKKDGTKVPISDSAAPVISVKGSIIGCVVVFRDVSRERDIDRAKTEFVSLASHQLRTPLATVNWYSEMLLGGDVGSLSDKQKEYLSEIYNGNKRMVELVNSLLSVSRIETGSFGIEPQTVFIREIIGDLLKDMKAELTAKQIVITPSYDDVDTANVDPKLLRLILQNLLTNSVHYTPAGGSVSLTVTKTDKDILFTITDSGIGIPVSVHDKIFTKMYRADNARTIHPEGSGLGLYMVKNIIEVAGGKILFDSAEGKGSTFYVTIPLTGMKRKAGSKFLV